VSDLSDHLIQKALRAFESAQLLAETDPDACVNRAYYAAFHMVSAYFALKDKSFIKHSAVESSVHRDLVKTGVWDKSLGVDYSFLLRLRQLGDYGNLINIQISEAKEAVASG
jgi:uncharacterized protein (UPF0332 family)